MASSCIKDEEDATPPPPTGDSPALAAAKTEAVANYANIVLASYEDALSTAQILKTAIDAFVAAPSSSGFEGCKQAWLASRLPYLQTEAYRFADGPIDNADGPEGLLNAWPLDEAYIDYVEGNPNAGIINAPLMYPEITGEVLIALNEGGGETNISTGYHAIEFLLWGQDQSATGPGARDWSDYTAAPNADRRGQYLKVCAELLTGHLQYLVSAWATGASGNYRASFTSANANTSLTAMLQGIGFLCKGELAGQRMFVAFDTQEQEEEHSCFSDNTHNDIRMDIQGIENVFLGTYTRADGSTIMGTGIKDVVALVNNDAANTTAAMITEAKDRCYAIPAPFDQQIIGGDQSGPLYQAILALRSAGDQLAATAANMGLSITVE